MVFLSVTLNQNRERNNTMSIEALMRRLDAVEEVDRKPGSFILFDKYYFSLVRCDKQTEMETR